MIKRISAEFESPELAETAIKRVKDSINVSSSNIIYNKASDRAVKLRNGTVCTVTPTLFNTHRYFFTSVMESPSTEDIIPEPARDRTAVAYVLCEEQDARNVSSVFNAVGGLNIKIRNS